MTIEYASPERATAENWPPALADCVGYHETHGKYVSAQLRKRRLAHWWGEFATFVFETIDGGTRLALCSCNDTTDSGEFALYARTDAGVEELAHVGDVALSGESDRTYCKPSRAFLREEYDFDAWSHWQFVHEDWR